MYVLNISPSCFCNSGTLFWARSISFNGSVKSDVLAPSLCNAEDNSIALSGDINPSAKLNVESILTLRAVAFAAIRASPSTPPWNPNLFNLSKFPTTFSDTNLALTPRLLATSLTTSISLPMSFKDIPAFKNPDSSLSTPCPETCAAANNSVVSSWDNVTFLPNCFRVSSWTCKAESALPPILIVSKVAPAKFLRIASDIFSPAPI